ncbi:apoptosis regulator Bcl-2-like [Brachionichthys hirsutus]|uniref:apoptosis regulator Bcl-2-like n=1 Tax=Brachionichthys hirsutus TaxID=412623 RepID=UPI003604C885
MANDCNRVIVEDYICHKLAKHGYVWTSDDDRDEDAATNGSIVAPPPTLVRRCRGASATGAPHANNRTPEPPHVEAIHRVLREAGDELERLYRPDFAEMSRQLYLTSTTAQLRFAEVIDELFRDGVNWGRIIAFFEFGSVVCVECVAKEEMTAQVDNIVEWMTEYLNGHLNSWIEDNGGWVGLISCKKKKKSSFRCAWRRLL